MFSRIQEATTRHCHSSLIIVLFCLSSSPFFAPCLPKGTLLPLLLPHASALHFRHFPNSVGTNSEAYFHPQQPGRQPQVYFQAPESDPSTDNEERAYLDSLAEVCIRLAHIGNQVYGLVITYLIQGFFSRICKLVLPRFADKLSIASGLGAHCNYLESEGLYSARMHSRRNVISP